MPISPTAMLCPELPRRTNLHPTCPGFRNYRRKRPSHKSTGRQFEFGTGSHSLTGGSRGCYIRRTPSLLPLFASRILSRSFTPVPVSYPDPPGRLSILTDSARRLPKVPRVRRKAISRCFIPILPRCSSTDASWSGVSSPSALPTWRHRLSLSTVKRLVSRLACPSASFREGLQWAENTNSD